MLINDMLSKVILSKFMLIKTNLINNILINLSLHVATTTLRKQYSFTLHIAKHWNA